MNIANIMTTNLQVHAGTVPAPVPEVPPTSPDTVPTPPTPRPPDHPPEIIEPPQPGEHVPVRDPYPAGPPSAVVMRQALPDRSSIRAHGSCG